MIKAREARHTRIFEALLSKNTLLMYVINVYFFI